MRVIQRDDSPADASSRQDTSYAGRRHTVHKFDAKVILSALGFDVVGLVLSSCSSTSGSQDGGRPS